MHIKNISAKTSKWTLIVFLLYTGISTVLKNVEMGNPPMIQDLTERQIFYFQIQQYYGYLQQMYIFILAALVYFEKKYAWAPTFVLILITFIANIIFLSRQFDLVLGLSFLCISLLLYIVFLPQTRKLFGITSTKDIILGTIISVILIVFLFFGINMLLLLLIYP